MYNVSFCGKKAPIPRCKTNITERVAEQFRKETEGHPIAVKAEQKVAEISNEAMREATKQYYAPPFQSPKIEPPVKAEQAIEQYNDYFSKHGAF